MHPLANRVIAVPETRELDVLVGLLERRGAQVIRCPLVAIKDAPDSAPVLAWVREFNASSWDDFILLTGEGLRRILSCVDRNESALRGPFVDRLAHIRKITRGPKPARVLRDLGLKADVPADEPTTAGVIAALQREDLRGRHVAVQLYGSDPNTHLIDFLSSAGAAVHVVAPYVYADAADDQAVRAMLTQLASGAVDAIAFTSTPQVERLFAVGPEDLVKSALTQTRIAAVGPVVRSALERHGINVNDMPEDSFFMKPLVSALEEAFGAQGATM
jgi:uroporphyrinogen-III synthase